MDKAYWITGTLTSHPRGRRLCDLLGAQSCDTPPEGHGVCLLMGSDFQSEVVDVSHWCQWANVAGRMLLLVPPFNITDSTVPTTWAVHPREQPPHVKTDGLPAVLASEVRYRITGRLQIPTTPGGSDDEGMLHTGFYRQHPHAGILVITTLPVWSLSVIHAKETFHTWLDQLYQLAGMPVEEPAPAPEPLRLSVDHFTVLLHLLQQDREDKSSTLTAIASSLLFNISEERAAQCYAELAQHGFTCDGRLTDQGRQCVFTSPYRLYARELERRTP